MLSLQRFELHDSRMHSIVNSRWTVDCTSFYDFLEEKRSGVTAALKQGLSERGPKLVSAVDEFVDAVTPGNNPAAGTQHVRNTAVHMDSKRVVQKPSLEMRVGL